MSYSYRQKFWTEYITSKAADSRFEYLYKADALAQKRRYLSAVKRFGEIFGEGETAIISAPGRTELGGNHTDHQRGRVLAAAVSLDKLAVVRSTKSTAVRIYTEGFGMDAIDLCELEPKSGEEGSSAALVRGVSARLNELSYSIGGFDAYISSEVPQGSGLSSSASFEILISSIFNYLYNDGKIQAIEMAYAGQFAENVYFGKPCGLMDQLSISVGGAAEIDFGAANVRAGENSAPKIALIDGGFLTDSFRICVVNTGGNHSELTSEYADITKDMLMAARYFGAKLLCEVPADEFYANLPQLRKKLSDRAILRAMHFFGENERVPKQAEALRNGDAETYIDLMLKSGDSSFKLLQNIYPSKEPERAVALALAMSQRILDGRGAWRVHGGGFAGTIQALVPLSLLDVYAKEMRRAFGDNSVYFLTIRPLGGACLCPESDLFYTPSPINISEISEDVL